MDEKTQYSEAQVAGSQRAAGTGTAPKKPCLTRALGGEPLVRQRKYDAMNVFDARRLVVNGVLAGDDSASGPQPDQPVRTADPRLLLDTETGRPKS